MTAVSVFIRPAAAYIVTDGMVNNRGTKTPLCKVATFPHLRAALVTRGNIQIGAGLAAYVGFMRHSMEEAARSFADDLTKIRAGLLHKIDGCAEAQAVLVGWPEAGSVPEAVFASCGPAGDGGPTLFSEIVMPALPDPVVFDAPQDAVGITAAQRSAYPDDVGGFVELTTIYRDRIVSEILHRWPEDFTAPAA